MYIFLCKQIFFFKKEPKCFAVCENVPNFAPHFV